MSTNNFQLLNLTETTKGADIKLQTIKHFKFYLKIILTAFRWWRRRREVIWSTAAEYGQFDGIHSQRITYAGCHQWLCDGLYGDIKQKFRSNYILKL